MNDAPLTSFRLATENLKRRPFRNVCLVLVVGLFAFTLFGGAVLNESLHGGLRVVGERLGADILLVPYGYEKKMEGALLRGEPSTFYLNEGLPEKLKGFPGIRKVSPQLFLSSLNAVCCTEKIQLIGYNPSTDFVVRPWMKNAAGTNGELADDEVVVGNKILLNVGDEAMFFSRTFRVAGKLDRTGMGFDTSVFMTIPAARALMKGAGILSDEADIAGDFVSSVVVSVEEGYEPRDVTNAIFRAYAMDWNLDALVTKTMVSDIASQLYGFSFIILILSGILWLLAAAILLVVFSAMLNERRREFALLRLFGASRKWLRRLVITEAFLIACIGAFLGTAMACMALFPFGALIFQAIGLPYMQPPASTLALYLAAGFGIAVSAGPLACACSTIRLGRSDIGHALRTD